MLLDVCWDYSINLCYQELLFYSVVSEMNGIVFFFYNQPENMLNVRLRSYHSRYALTANCAD